MFGIEFFSTVFINPDIDKDRHRNLKLGEVSSLLMSYNIANS